MTREAELSQLRKLFPSWSIVSQRHFNIREYVAIKMLDNYRVLRHSANTIDELKKLIEE
jgi:hypothetical protein